MLKSDAKLQAEELMTLTDAARWATGYLKREVTVSNIGYLIQYAKIRKIIDADNSVKVDKYELKKYYDGEQGIRAKVERKLGISLDWEIAFDGIPERERTKHVHRLHPYKGKFIPQLVEYFLDDHVDTLKKEVYFKPGETVLDPFLGSGTTLVVASELGINSIGIDISEFNCMIAEAKVDDYILFDIGCRLRKALDKLSKFVKDTFDDNYDLELKRRIQEFNRKYFPNPEYKWKLRDGKINEKEYSEEKLELFFTLTREFFDKNGTRDKTRLIDEKTLSPFVYTWFTHRIRQEIAFYANLIEGEEDPEAKRLMKIILSRTARSCRATTHSDLATLVSPQYMPYYCHKHFKICTPVNSIIGHLRKNTEDTIDRINQYSKLKKTVKTTIINSDSRSVNIDKELSNRGVLPGIAGNDIIDGIFTSPPYVGQIDYHEQHAYAYEIFNLPRKDELEIGKMSLGKGKKAQEAYVQDVSAVMSNVLRFVKERGNIFIVANDKFGLYPRIAELSGLEIIKTFHRPVFDRAERDQQPYSESIFHMRKKILLG